MSCIILQRDAAPAIVQSVAMRAWLTAVGGKLQQAIGQDQSALNFHICCPDHTSAAGAERMASTRGRIRLFPTTQLIHRGPHMSLFAPLPCLTCTSHSTSTSTVLHSASSQPNRGLKQTQAGCISHQVGFHTFFPALLILILTPQHPQLHHRHHRHHRQQPMPVVTHAPAHVALCLCFWGSTSLRRPARSPGSCCWLAG